MPSLADYLDEVASRDCGFGRMDCATLMADWLMACGYGDPMADRRGTYTTERAYRAAVRSEGGLVASCGRRFAALGLPATARPVAGDVALVLSPIGCGLKMPTGAIAAGEGRFALLAWPRGVVTASLPLTAAWSVWRG